MAANGLGVAPSDRPRQRRDRALAPDVLDRSVDQRQQRVDALLLGPAERLEHAHGLGHGDVEEVRREHRRSVVDGALRGVDSLRVRSQPAGESLELAAKRRRGRVDGDGHAAKRRRRPRHVERLEGVKGAARVLFQGVERVQAEGAAEVDDRQPAPRPHGGDPARGLGDRAVGYRQEEDALGREGESLACRHQRGAQGPGEAAAQVAPARDRYRIVRTNRGQAPHKSRIVRTNRCRAPPGSPTVGATVGGGPATVTG